MKLVRGGSVMNRAYTVWFSTVLNKEYVIRFWVFLLLYKFQKLRQPYLCHLFTSSAMIAILVEPNKMMLGILIDQS